GGGKACPRGGLRSGRERGSSRRPTVATSSITKRESRERAALASAARGVGHPGAVAAGPHLSSRRCALSVVPDPTRHGRDRDTRIRLLHRGFREPPSFVHGSAG